MNQVALFLKLSQPKTACDFWVKMFPIAKKNINLRDSYVLLVNRELKEQTLAEINERLSDPENLENSYLINDAIGGRSMLQSLQYVELEGYSGLIFSSGDSLTSHLKLADEISEAFEITNLLIEDLGSG